MLLDDIDAMNEYMNRVSAYTFSSFDVDNKPSEKEPERFYHRFVLGLMIVNFLSDFSLKDTSREEIRIGAFLVVCKILEEYELLEILKKYLRIKDCGLFLDLAAYSIVAENNAARYYPDYAYNHPLFTAGMHIYSDSKVSDFFASVTDDQRIGFLAGGSIPFNSLLRVCALGTIGTLLVMFLLDAGINNLFVIGKKEFQRQTMLTMGIAEECYCDSRSSDVGKWISEHTNGSGVDVFFECVGRNETVVQAIDSTAPAGKICMVGNPYSDIEFDKNTYWKILRNQLTVTGTWNSSFVHSAEDDWHYVLSRLEWGKISPSKLISHRFSLEDIEKGFHIMRDKSEDYIKIMAEK